MPQVPQEVGHLKNFEKTKKKRTPGESFIEEGHGGWHTITPIGLSLDAGTVQP